MKEIDIYIRITTTLLGITYPILLQVVARLDDRYSSVQIVELFDSELDKRRFKQFLIISIILIGVKTFEFSEPTAILNHLQSSLGSSNKRFYEFINYITINSADILVLLSTTTLIIFFFFYVEKVLIYYTPSKFIKYLMRKYDKTDSIKYFTALSDILYFSIQKQIFSLTDELSEYFYQAFNNERVISELPAVVYPNEYYTLVNKSIEELALLKSKKNKKLELRTAGAIWLLGEMSNTRISEKTYSWLWANLLLEIKYEQDDMVNYYWRTANQYMVYSIGMISPDIGYDEHNNLVQVNKKEQEENRLDRQNFLEFNYALGGVLLYKQRYDCLNKILQFTNSQPPSYELLPDSMNEIFEAFVKFYDIHNNYFPFIDLVYPFPDQFGVQTDGLIRKWICSYIALMFLRQYTLHEYYVYQKFLAFPDIPEEQNKKNEYIQCIEYFKQLVQVNLNNLSLITTLGYQNITREWCRDNRKIYPLDFFDALLEKINEAHRYKAINQSIDEEKVSYFLDKSSEILSHGINRYGVMNQEDGIVDNYDKWYIVGQRMIYDKDTFVKQSEVHYINYEETLANHVLSNVEHLISYIFTQKVYKKYVIREEELFEAIDLLNITNEYIILDNGLNIEYKNEKIKNGFYNNIEVVKIPYMNQLGNSIFVLRKSDLPNLISLDVDQELKDKYKLKAISEFNNLYASIVDLNIDEALLKEESEDAKSEGDEKDLRKSVLATIALKREIRWKKESKMIQISRYNEYFDNGHVDNLQNVDSIHE